MRHASRTQETEIALSNQGTHGATELAMTLRPPEVSVWSGDIDLHIRIPTSIAASHVMLLPMISSLAIQSPIG